MATDDKGSGYGSRKFLLTAGAMLSASLMVFTGHVSDGVYSTIMLGALAAYITGNVSQRNAMTKADAATDKVKLQAAHGGVVLE